MKFLPRFGTVRSASFMPQISKFALIAPTITIEKLFFLNTLPRQENVKYVILASGIIESDKVIMA